MDQSERLGVPNGIASRRIEAQTMQVFLQAGDGGRGDVDSGAGRRSC